MTRRRKNGQGRPTIHTVAQVAGVGVGTVSRVLNNHPSVRDDTRERIMAVMADLGYQPSPGRRPAPTDQQLIAVLMEDLYSPWESRILGGIEQVLGSEGYDIAAFPLNVPGRLERALLPSHPSRSAQGVLICSEPMHRLWDPEEPGPPAVRLGSISTKLDYVAIDNWQGGRLAGEYAAGLPGEVVGLWLTEERELPQRAAIRHGFTEAVEQSGRTVRRLGLGLQDHVYRVAEQVLDQVPEQVTIMAHADSIAVALLEVAQARGMPVGQDLRIIGYGDHLEAALYDLTTVHQPLELLAERGTRMLLDRLNEQRSGRPRREQQWQMIEPRLALRGSA
ncbi:LacI family DNA-binding transcriptional regulator [Deinococcus radiophilus]|uniref:LacI family transcriptional regulator n=1 Tax=Deinococcus radiophilus TaxID=32062 RepID=A0A431W349_9DEIO|nr:LacI family DNA-binding transcriptional regulator [Deinococcus radiophilus]RTR29850.1 LacI family transcriptional regulator [Deinococcus radiophilus]UFA49798.1 LacI family transcriptional regulator [Deinococcus radiophilus]